MIGSCTRFLQKCLINNGLFGNSRDLTWAVLIWVTIQIAATAVIFSTTEDARSSFVYWWWPLLDGARVLMLALVRIIWLLRYVQCVVY